VSPTLAVATVELAVRNDRLARQNERPFRWTYCGVMAVPGISMLLGNLPCDGGGRTTRAIVAYDSLHPVIIRERVQ